MPESLYEKEWTTAARKAHKAAGGYFAGSDGDSFPLADASDVSDAWNLAGHDPHPDQVRANIKRWAKANGHYDALPQTAKDEDKEAIGARESAFAPPALGSPTIATLTMTFIEDDAISLNGRRYPREAVNKLIQSAQIQLSDPDAAPLTCYISHDAADQDNSLLLTGKITSVWREGTKGKAKIALVNTSAGRDMAVQAHGGFMRTMSLRASNAEIKREKGSDMPVVGGENLRLDGIDFTATPGIPVAKIQDVALAENAREGPQRLHEVFDAQAPLLEWEKVAPMEKPKLNEADQGGNMPGGYTPTSGDAPSLDGSPGGGKYGDAMYKQPDMTSGQMQGMAPAPALQEAHNRIAIVQGRSCAPSRESKEWRKAMHGMTEREQREAVRLWQLLEAGRLREAGKALSKKNDGHLDVAHDSLARHMQMDCEGANSKMARYDPDGDGDDDSTDDPAKNPDYALDKLQDGDQMESATAKKGGDSPMTEDEALKLLEAKGYNIARPKTADEVQQERLEAVKAEHTRQLEEMKAEQARQLAEQEKRLEEQMRGMIASTIPDPQRRSLVLGATVTESSTGRHQPLRGKYLQEKIKALDWQRMAYDRTTPLPTDQIPLDLLMKEFEHMYAVSYDDWAKQVYNIAPVYDR